MELTERFADVVGRDEVALDEALLLVAAHADDSCNIAESRARLDELGAAVASPDLEALCRTLFVDQGFAGNRADYYDPRNSYLHDVLDRRRGIPITLSVLAIEVGRRAGVPLVGVATPAHFVARDATDADRFVDAFDHGRILDRRGLEAMLATIAPGVDVEPFLRPASATDIVRRVLNNLVAIHRSRGDRDACLWATELRTLVPGATADDHRAFGGALAASGDYVRAAKILEALVDDGRASDPDRALAEAQQLRARLN